MAKNWIAGAIKHPGALTRSAKKAGESPMAFARQHKGDSGTTGKRARLALTLQGFKSHMPKGASLSPSGDIGAKRGMEAMSAFSKKIKNSGRTDPNPLHYRKPEVASDDGRNTSL